MLDQQKMTQNLEEIFLNAWQEVHGYCRGDVSILWDAEQLVTIINGAFSRAERELAQKRSGENLLVEYETELLNQIVDKVIQEVQTSTAKKVISHTLSMNIPANKMVFHFQLSSG